MSLYQILTIIFPLIIIFILTWFIRSRKKMLDTIDELKQEQGSTKKNLETVISNEKKQQDLFDMIMDNIPHGILLLDGQLKISKINENVANLFYLDRKKVLGSKTIILFNNKRLEDLIEKVLKKGQPQKKEITFYGDEDITLDTDVVPLNVDNYSLLILLRNTTQEVEFSRLRSQFVANVSHEMRTPLTSIRGYVETALENDLSNKAIAKKHLTRTLDEVDRLNFLIEDVLNLSNIEFKRNVILKQNNNIVDIIKDCIESLAFLAEKNDVRIRFEYSDNPVKILTDEELIRQLVKNLLENSIFHGGKGIELDISIVEGDFDVSIVFSDNGVGIDKKDLPFIFQRFYRGKNLFSTRKIGSGLGLSIVKHIVELHGGKIDVVSIPNKETRFTIILPKLESVS